MHKPFLLLSTLLIFMSCQSKSQDNIDKSKAEKLYKEAKPLFKKFLEFQISGKDSAKIINKQLINIYEEIYKADTLDENVGHYLANFYTYDKQYSKAFKWYLEALKYDTFEPDIATHNQEAAFCLINLGEFDSAKIFLKKAIDIISADKTTSSFRLQGIFSSFKQIADDINYMKDQSQIKLFSSKKIIPCKYSIELLNYMLPITQQYLNTSLIPFNADTISLRKKDCTQ